MFEKEVKTTLQEDFDALGIKRTPEQVNMVGTSSLEEAIATGVSIGSSRTAISSDEYASIDEEVRDFLDEVMTINLEMAEQAHLDRVSDLMDSIDFDKLDEDLQEYYNKVAVVLNEAYVELQEKIKRGHSYGKMGTTAKKTVREVKPKGQAHSDTMQKKHKKGYRQQKLSQDRARKRPKFKKRQDRIKKTKKSRGIKSSLAQELQDLMNESATSGLSEVQQEIVERIKRIMGILNWFMEDEEVEEVLDEAYAVMGDHLVEGVSDNDFATAISKPIDLIARLCEEVEEAADEKN